MNKTLSTLSTLGAAAALVLASLSAQAMDDKKGHAMSKADAASGAIAKGEGPPAIKKPMAGETSRAEVKSGARHAADGDTMRRGEASPKIPKTHKGTVSRAEVKSEAAEAVKDGDIAKGPNVPKSGGVAKP